MSRKRAHIYYNLSTLLAAGVPILRSLKTAASGLSGRLPQTIRALATEISSGQTLPEAMTARRKMFPALDLTMVRAADTAGSLPECFRMLSRWYDLRDRLIRKITSAALLPVVLIHLVALIAPLPVLFLVHKSIGRYPLDVLRILSIFYVPAAIMLALWYLASRTPSLRHQRDSLVLRIAVLGPAVRHLALSRFCRAFNMLYKAGVPVVESVQKACDVAGNAVIASQLRNAADSAAKGNTLSEGFPHSLPQDFINIFETGEQVGSLDRVTYRLAENHADSADVLLTRFARLLPGLIYLMVCVVMIGYIFRNFALIHRSI